jgi:hypothetical protein
MANIILNGKWKHFLLNRNEKRVSTFFNAVLEFLSRAVRQEKEIKVNQIGKEDFKVSLFAVNMILYFKERKYFTKIILHLVKKKHLAEQ